MDVYEILDKKAFLDSVSQLTATTVVLPSATTNNAGSSGSVDLTDSSGATAINTSISLLLLVSFFNSLSYFAFSFSN